MMLDEKKEYLSQKISEAQFVAIAIGTEWDIVLEQMIKEKEFIDSFYDYQIEDPYCNTVEYMKTIYTDTYIPDELGEAYHNLYKLVQDKDFFVVSLNSDRYPYHMLHCKNKCVFPCGRYDMLQCDSNCDDELYPINEYFPVNGKANEFKSFLKTPICTKCGKPLVLNSIHATKYNEKGYVDQWSQYMEWLQKTMNRNLVMLELGVSKQLSEIIRDPFEKNAFYSNKACLIRIHETDSDIPESIYNKGISIPVNSVKFMADLGK